MKFIKVEGPRGQTPLSPDERAVLNALRENGCSSTRDVGRLIKRSTSFAGRVLKGLLKKKLVRRVHGATAKDPFWALPRES